MAPIKKMFDRKSGMDTEKSRVRTMLRTRKKLKCAPKVDVKKQECPGCRARYYSAIF